MTSLRLAMFALLAMSAIAVPGPAIAADGQDVTHTGTILVGQPEASLFGNPLSLVNGCEDGGALDGIDGDVIELADGAPGHPWRLTFSSALPADLMVDYFTQDCAYLGTINDGSFGAPEEGFVPAGTKFMIIVGAGNGPVDHELTVFHSQPNQLPPSPDPATLHDLDRVEPLTVTTDDGTVLGGHVYLPTGTGPFAIILELNVWFGTAYQPTGGWETQVDGRRTIEQRFRPFLDAGFAVALMNVRGTGNSEGCFQFNGPLAWQDAAAIVDALAEQAWSTGAVGMYGHSFSAGAALQAMAARPDGLDAVVVASPLVNPWLEETIHGATTSGRTSFQFFAQVLAEEGTVNSGSVPNTGPSRIACPRYAEDLQHDKGLGNGDWSPYWQERNLLPHLDGSSIPVLLANGMKLLSFDNLNTGEPEILQLEGLWDRLADDRHVIFGQWGHEIPTARRPDWESLAVSFFDQHLRGGPPAFAGPDTVEYQDDTGQWHSASRWPPVTQPMTLWLSDGTLTDDPDAVVTSQHAYESGGIPCLGTCPYVGVPRQPVCVGDQVVYTSPPVDQDMHLAGSFTLRTTITSTLPNGNLSVYLWQTDGTGGCPDPASRHVARAPVDLRHVLDRDGRPFPVFEQTEVTLTSLPFATVIPAGNRLVLAIGAESFEIIPNEPKPLVTVATGPGVAGVLTLPVIEPGGSVASALASPPDETLPATGGGPGALVLLGLVVLAGSRFVRRGAG